MKYGQIPMPIGVFNINCKEMMCYQYLPIKMIGETIITIEERLSVFNELLGAVCCDFIGVYGLDRYVQSYVYLTAKYLYQVKGCPFNRGGYHSDGFMTEDINYIWCDANPTVFNRSEFNLSMDESGSLVEMETQAKKENEMTFPVNICLRLDQYNIHKVSEDATEGMRAFVKISFSKDKYDLIGNAHNYLINYDWQMKERKKERNVPQTLSK